MKPLGLSQYRVAKDMGVYALRISQIVHAKRSITVDTAMRLARYLRVLLYGYGSRPVMTLKQQGLK